MPRARLGYCKGQQNIQHLEGALCVEWTPVVSRWQLIRDDSDVSHTLSGRGWSVFDGKLHQIAPQGALVTQEDGEKLIEYLESLTA